MATWPLYSSDNGYVVRRLGLNNWDIVYTSALGSHSAGGCRINHLTQTPSAPEQIILTENQQAITFKSTTDGGVTWTTVTPVQDTGGPGFITGLRPGYRYNVPFSKDYDGTLYGTGNSGAPSINVPDAANFELSRSIDGGTHWPYLFWATNAQFTSWGIDSGSPPISGPIIENGYAWWITWHFASFPATFADGVVLLRIDMDGSNPTPFYFTGGSYATDFAAGDWFTNTSGYTSSRYGTNRLYLFSKNIGDKLASIDVSNPAAPTLFTFPRFTNGAMTAVAVHITPITNQIAVAMVNEAVIFAGTPDEGALFRTTDAGANWSLVVPWTTDLYGSVNEMSRSDGGVRVEYGDPNVLWAGLKIPHTYYSTDGGVNWTQEDYNGPSLGAGTTWTGLVAGPASPVVRRARSWGWVTS